MIPAAAAFPAADAAFYAVFGVFVVAFVVLSVITVGWALRQDRTGRQRWLQRQQPGAEAVDPDGGPSGGPSGGAVAGGTAPPATNGHRPPAGRRGRPRRPPG